MKPTMLFTLSLGLLISFSALSQDSQMKASIISAKTLSLSANNIMTLENNVSVKTDLLLISDAKKVQIDQKQNKITVFGEAVYEFSGRLVVLPLDSSKERRLEYTIGEQVAYLR